MGCLINIVSLVGNITRDPEYRQLQSGVSCCQFTVACQRRYKNAQGQYDADFINCVAWRQTADFVHKYFIKGNRIGLTGTIQTRSYEGQDGNRHYVTEVIAENVEFVSARSEGGGEAAPPPRTPAQQQRMNLNQGTNDDFTEVDDDDLPF